MIQLKKINIFLPFLGILLSYGVLAQCAGEVTSAPSGLNIRCPEFDYVLTFHDEFNGTQLNTDLWHTKGTAPVPADRMQWVGCKNLHQIYLDSNVIISNGNANIIAKRQDFVYEFIAETSIYCNDGNTIIYNQGDSFSQSFEITSGMILGQQAFKPDNHLIIESKIKIPKGRGLWPSFWTWHHDEIDCFEFFNSENDDYFQTNYHHSEGGMCPQDVHKNNLSENFHLYKIEITPWFIKWFLDDELVRTVPKFYTIDGKIATQECNQILPASNYILNTKFPDINSRWFSPFLNLAVNSNFDINEISGLPANMQVDYVRMYQKLPKNHIGNICYYGIKGDDSICQGEILKFDFESNVDIEEIKWKVSNNLTIIDKSNNHISVAISSNENESTEGFIEVEVVGTTTYCPENIIQKHIQINPVVIENFEIIENKLTCVGHSGLGKYTTRPKLNVSWEILSGPVNVLIPESDYTLLEATNTGTFLLEAKATGRCGDISIAENEFESVFCDTELIKALSPNPVDDLLTVEFGNVFIGNELQVFVFNSTSEIMFQKNTTYSEVQIDVSNYMNGIYFLQIISQGKNDYISFVVSH